MNGWESVHKAAFGGRPDCSQCIRNIWEDWEPETTWAAAFRGHLDCLKYAHENGCPWDPNTTWVAAKHGRLDCLKYAHENGAPTADNNTKQMIMALYKQNISGLLSGNTTYFSVIPKDIHGIISDFYAGCMLHAPA